MANIENLIQFNSKRTPQTPEERREQARRAGIASGIARRKKRALKDVLTDLLAAELSDEDETKKILEDMGVEASQEAAIGLAMIQKARKGEVEAARYLRDSSGQKITESYSVETIDGSEGVPDFSTMSTEELRMLIRKAKEEQAQIDEAM